MTPIEMLQSLQRKLTPMPDYSNMPDYDPPVYDPVAPVTTPITQPSQPTAITRVEQTPIAPTSPVSQPATEDKRMRVSLLDNDNQPTGYSIFSSDGEPKSKAEFTKAINQYAEDKSTPEGFAVLPPGGQQFFRRLFEAGNQPIQEAARGLAESPTPGLADPNKPYDPRVGQPVSEQLAALLHGAQQIPLAVTSTFNKPETAGALAGQIGAAAATGGSSLPIQIGAAMLGTGAGRMAGGALTGGRPQPGEAVKQAVLAGGVTTATGALKIFMGRGLSQQAREGMAGDLVAMLKTKHSSISSDPKALEAIASTPSGAADFVQQGVKALRGDADILGKSMLADVQLALPRNLSKGTQNTFRAEIRKFISASNDLLDNIGDAKSMQAAYKNIYDAKQAMGQLVLNEFKGQTTLPQTVMKLKTVFNNQEAAAARFEDGAQVIAAMKNASKNGFNPRLFQQEMRNVFKANPGSAMNEAGILAGRPAGGYPAMQAGGTGADISQMIDQARSINVGVPFLKKLGVSANIPIGSSYVGTVPKQNPTATMIGNAAIRSYFSKDKSE